MVTDHDHVVQYIRGNKGFVKGGCGECGKPTMVHLSWGRLVASRVGGDPLDYVQKEKEEA